MPLSISRRGGARIGWARVAFPFCGLTVSHDLLTLNVPYLGKYTFAADEVVGIEPHTVIPFLRWGLRIRHCKLGHPKTVIFWYLGNPSTLLRDIQSAGFVPAGTPNEELTWPGFPCRWPSVILAILVWNALLIADEAVVGDSQGPGFLGFACVLLFFAASIAIRTWTPLQGFVMKPNRSVQEIMPWLRLFTILLGLVAMVHLSRLLM